MGKLQSLIDNKAQSAKFMCDEIAHICNDMPKRDPGSEGEKMACEYMADYLKHDCGCERSTKNIVRFVRYCLLKSLATIKNRSRKVSDFLFCEV